MALEELLKQVDVVLLETNDGRRHYEQAEAIFDRFTKLNDFVQGTGLGLSICRDIASRMGAKVYLDTSYTAGGARFVLEVPVEAPEGEDITPPRS